MDDDGPQIVEMKESEWVTPEEIRLRKEIELLKEAEKKERAKASSGPRTSIVISDAFLGVHAIGSAILIYTHMNAQNHYSLLLALIGCFIMSLAAFAGCFRFGLGDLPPLVFIHDRLTAVSMIAGFPMVAIGAVLVTEWDLKAFDFNKIAVIVVVVVMLLQTQFQQNAKTVGTLLSLASGVLVISKSIALYFRYGSLVPSVLMFGGVVIGVLSLDYSKGKNRDSVYFSLILGVDVFHYLFALSLFCIVLGIVIASQLQTFAHPLLLSVIFRK